MIPKIQKVEFGNIVINGESYGKTDFILYWDKVERVEKTHEPSLLEFKRILLKEPDVIIYSLGFSNCVRIDERIKVMAKKEGVELILLSTPDALKRFKLLSMDNKKVIARIHTTC